jgi:hypothetical protein
MLTTILLDQEDGGCASSHGTMYPNNAPAPVLWLGP